MLKVLVVDDDAGLRFSVREQLASTGLYSVEEAFDGLKAVEMVRASRFDLVIRGQLANLCYRCLYTAHRDAFGLVSRKCRIRRIARERDECPAARGDAV